MDFSGLNHNRHFTSSQSSSRETQKISTKTTFSILEPGERQYLFPMRGKAVQPESKKLVNGLKDITISDYLLKGEHGRHALSLMVTRIKK